MLEYSFCFRRGRNVLSPWLMPLTPEEFLIPLAGVHLCPGTPSSPTENRRTLEVTSVPGLEGGTQTGSDCFSSFCDRETNSQVTYSGSHVSRRAVQRLTVCRPAVPADSYRACLRWSLRGLGVFRSIKEIENQFAPVIPTSRRLRQEGLQFQASLGYRGRLEYRNPRLTRWLSSERCLPAKTDPQGLIPGTQMVERGRQVPKVLL